jgi:flavin-dependent dehydrogenase
MPEVVIIGGGLAGSASAITLAKAGRDVLLLERESKPQHKVCGEFLSQEAVHSLHSLGIDPRTLGARVVHSVRLADARRVTASALPFTAMSLTRKQLDEALLQQAERNGATVVRGSRALQLQQSDDCWRITMESADFVTAKAVFIATGKHDLTGQPRPAGVQRNMVGFKTYFALEPNQAAELAGHIELMLFRGGYAGLQLVEDGSANLGLIIEKATLQSLGGRWENVLAMMQQDCPHLAERLRGAEPLLERPLAVSSLPYGFVRSRAVQAQHGGVWSLGDQAAVIPSFTGDGMAIALHSGRLAASMYLEGATAQAYQEMLHRQLASQVRLATVFSRGLVWPPSRTLFTAMARLWPKSLDLIARHTRIAESALLS